MDDDLDLLRSYRAADAVPPRGLQERLEEDLLHAMLDATAAPVAPTPIRATGSSRPGWFANLRRPALAFGALAALAIGVATFSNGGVDLGSSTTGAAGVTQASSNPFDGTASSVFGASSGAAIETTPFADTLEAPTPTTEAAALAAGPAAASDATMEALTRNPQRLAQVLRDAPAEQGVDDPGDRLAFHVALAWITDTRAPVQLRAALLRSLGGLEGVDAAYTSLDPLDRQGIAIGHTDTQTGLREQYLLSANGGELLERRSFTTTYVDPACPPGTYTYDEVYVNGQAVGASQMPWRQWPNVIGDCDPVAS
ncbi:MAG: hypothetical protein JWN72_327 [Thermoleophilia bacterium]|nr:hypothetical protein [Thermoleophilia bacterium]